jgi:septum formation protein
MKLILASASPRRAEILRNAGIQFEVRATDVDESRLTGEVPGDYVRRLALAKALSAATEYRDSRDEALVLGADTVVVVDADILGKPASQDDARSMLRRISGRMHEVHTGLALVRAPGTMQRVVEEITRVHFASLTEREIEDYIATGEAFDKAGAYAIQGIAGRYVSRIEGCYFNVMGLPLARLWSLLRELGGQNSMGAQMGAK